MSLYGKALLFFLGSLPVALGERFVNLPEISPPYETYQALLESNLKTYLPLPAYTTSYWPSGYLPEPCKQEAENYGLSPWTMVAMNVTYADCPTPWVLCRHYDQPQSVQTILDIFGRVPVRMRQVLADLIVMPYYIDNGMAAGTGDRTTATFVPVDIWLLLHELYHALDSTILNQLVGGPNFSISDEFSDAVNEDTAVVSGTNDLIEGAADLARIVTYDVNVPGGYLPTHPNAAQISNAVAKMREYGALAGNVFTASGTCNGNKALPRLVVPI